MTRTSVQAGLPPKPRAAVVRDALGVGTAVGLSGFAFGVTSAGAGMSVVQTCVLSLFVFTGASQFALVGALGTGGNPLAAAAGALLLGVRNAFYGLRLSQLLGLPAAVRPFAAQWVIDETSAVALAQSDRRLARLGFTVTGASLYAGWNITTFLGALGASALGDPAAWGLDVAGPAVFLALLLPMLRGRSAAPDVPGPDASGADASGADAFVPGGIAGERPVAKTGPAGTGTPGGTSRGTSGSTAFPRQEAAVAALAVVLALACVPFVPAGVPVLVAVLAAPAVLAVSRIRARRRVRRRARRSPQGGRR
ncbi:AzlC family ABC transporter permease [Microbispora sp. H13382]|uniref:AzlC family ABC transporter permease n=1 Tax=Microbispora sp. H13382 TaxID=2729112 RepID=UPI00287397F4|nr:AzlC family ABC transporter permease [Microbispora sp. H13382]